MYLFSFLHCVVAVDHFVRILFGIEDCEVLQSVHVFDRQYIGFVKLVLKLLNLIE